LNHFLLVQIEDDFFILQYLAFIPFLGFKLNIINDPGLLLPAPPSVFGDTSKF